MRIYCCYVYQQYTYLGKSVTFKLFLLDLRKRVLSIGARGFLFSPLLQLDLVECVAATDP